MLYLKIKHSDDYNLTINDINLVINKIMIIKHYAAAKKKILYTYKIFMIICLDINIVYCGLILL